MRAPALVGLLCLGVAGCSQESDRTMQGYGEAEYVYVAAQDAGLIQSLRVREGDTVTPGETLVQLDPARAQFSYDSAKATLDAARSRAAENGSLAEAVRQAQANADLATRNLNRTTELVANGTSTRADLDRDRAADQAARAALAAARAEREAALRDLGAAQGNADLAKRRLDDLKLAASAKASVERVYHRSGEVVAAGAPILALLPPGNMKIRFFAPEAMLASLKIGGEVAIACDGCAPGLKATISFIAAEPQFTPPVIYSLDERDKLTFLVEARLAGPGAVRPGLPVDVTPLP